MKTYIPKYSGPCAKAVVSAILTTPDGAQYKSTNFCLTPQEVCPRNTQGYPSGEGYHLCKTVCNQLAHAEENVIYFARKQGAKIRGSVIEVDYTWICNNCSNLCNLEGISVTISKERECNCTK